MNKLEKFELEPWYDSKSDFLPNDAEYEISRPYRLWFEFLRISPAYALAGEIFKERIRSRDRTKMPSNLLDVPFDIEEVIRTFDDFGYVRDIDFKSWWQQNSSYLFPKVPRKASTSSVFKVFCQEEQSIDNCIDSVSDYMNVRWKELGRPSVILVAIPLTGTRKDIIKSVDKIISDEDINKANGILATQLHHYRLLGKRMRLDALTSKLRLLWKKAREPNLELWRLGVDAKLGEAYKILDSSKKQLNNHMREQTPIVASATRHALSDAIAIMENAARGRFPSTEKAVVSNVDFSSIKEVLDRSKNTESKGMNANLRRLEYRKKRWNNKK